jgi:hypothetical protein
MLLERTKNAKKPDQWINACRLMGVIYLYFLKITNITCQNFKSFDLDLAYVNMSSDRPNLFNIKYYYPNTFWLIGNLGLDYANWI